MNDADSGRPRKRAKQQELDPIKNGLCEALNAITPPGGFAAATKLAQTSALPIWVGEGVGLVKFPLQPQDAQRLISKARQAPYGNGTETFVDTSVRNTWELDATLLVLSDPWRATVKGLATWAGKQLGITGGVTAELYKMLLYEKGAMFKPHTDTEKIPGMFGTMVVCLPSAHEGGDLVLKHGGISKTFKSSEMQPSAFCWFSDVSHEVLPVTSAIRCVLTFNLASSQPVPLASATGVAQGMEEVRGALRAWMHSRNTGGETKRDCFYYMLDHTYTEANVSLHALKGADLSRMKALKQACEGLNVRLMLGVLEKVEEGGCEDDYGYGGWGRGYYDRYDDGEDEDEDEDEDEEENDHDHDHDHDHVKDERDHGDDDDDEDGYEEDEDGESWHSFVDVIDTSVTIKKLAGLEGSTIRTGMEIGMGDLEANLIQDVRDPFKGAKRGERDYSGFTGNEGVSATHWYRKTVAIIVPNDSIDQFLVKGITKTAAQSLLPQYLSKVDEPATAESGWKMVEHLAGLSWSSSHGVSAGSYYSSYVEMPRLDLEVVKEFFRATLSHGKYELFGSTLGWLVNELPNIAILLFEIVGSAALSDSLDFAQIKDSLLQVLSAIPISKRKGLLTAVAKPGGATCRECVRDWLAQEVVPRAVTDCSGEEVMLVNGRSIVEMISEYRDLDFFIASLAPLVEKQAHLTAFALDALLTALRLSDEGLFEKAATLTVCKPLFDTVLHKMDLSRLCSSQGVLAALETLRESRPRYAQILPVNQGGLAAKAACAIVPDTLAQCIAACIRHKWDDVFEYLQAKIVADVNCIPAAEFRPLWIPCLHKIIHTLEANNISLSTPKYQQLARAILEAYINKYIGTEPSGDVDHRQKPVACSCQDCSGLNTFLTGNEKVGRFSMGEKRRRHLENNLGYSRSGYTLNTESRGRPYTLVVTKGLDAGTRALQEWTNRHLEAQKDLSEFDREKMNVLLGDEAWERITSMRHLRYTGQSRGVRPAASARTVPLGTLTGRKRGRGDVDDPVVLN
ncbi:hypothetical protein B0T18DRAFT_372929 [Schizothecium vesticola]|uniref:Prolyl 4-hydroxylase alpha subunit Fe(2+) 2OG dioxygenase domain-containing protein n=1 Tax=Schizothecium vesticola TaxID=314040 RepID=A0AA40BTI2_9PEZI|nr:hypothetical protein B0T18DRAFT_372929 [Schizothecium vesticola]